MKRPLTVLTILLLSLVGLLQWARAAIGMEVDVGGTYIPVWASWLMGGVALSLAAGLWYESQHVALHHVAKQEVRSAPLPTAPTIAAAAPAVRAQATTAQLSTLTRQEAAPRLVTAPPTSPTSAGSGQFESVIIDGRPVPAAYFMFASETLSVSAIKKAVAKHGRVLVGFDAGYIPLEGEISGASFIAARDLGAELEIYVEGPGGKTGEKWDADEVARVKAAAQSVGIDTSDPSWRDEGWDKGGWKAYTFKQLGAYRKVGFNAGEIDNLDRVIKGPQQLVAFYKEYGDLQTAGVLPQLVMKNISVEDMTEVVAAVTRKELPRTMFSEFHIFECGNSDEWKEVDDLSKAIAIRTVPSRNTYKYNAEGKFGLADAFNKLSLPDNDTGSVPSA